METKQKLFAFKLAAEEDAKQAGTVSHGKWKALEGVAAAGCSLVKYDNYREYGMFGADKGYYC